MQMNDAHSNLGVVNMDAWLVCGLTSAEYARRMHGRPDKSVLKAFEVL